jgi:uncharacterized protein (DUF58 family)
VGPGETRTTSLDARAAQRGRYLLTEIAISTRFPFGFFEKWVPLPAADELWVLPVRVAAAERRAVGGYREGERPEGKAGRGAEFLGLRELSTGDDIRLVHWRKSAAVGRLLAVEREREQRRRVVLVVDNRGEALEQPVREAAAAARLLSGRGLEIGLATAGTYLPPAAGPGTLRRVLRALAALARAEPGRPAPDSRGEGVLRFGGPTA